jgi:hypothetical protein
MNDLAIFVLCFLDLPLRYAGFEGRYRNLSNLFMLALLSILFCILLLNWIHINERSGKMKYVGFSRRVLVIGCIMVVGAIVWTSIGMSFYMFRSPPGSLRDTALPKIMMIGGGLWILSCSVLFTFVLIGLIVYFVKILRRLLKLKLTEKDYSETDLPRQSSQQAADFAKHVLSVRITKILLAIASLIVGTQFFIVVAGIEFMLGDDILTVQVHFVFNLFLNIWVGMCIVVFVMIFFDRRSFYKAYSCCKRKPKRLDTD